MAAFKYSPLGCSTRLTLIGGEGTNSKPGRYGHVTMFQRRPQITRGQVCTGERAERRRHENTDEQRTAGASSHGLAMINLYGITAVASDDEGGFVEDES